MPLEKVIWGTPAREALPEEAERLGAQRVFIVASRSLTRKTEAVQHLIDALGDRYVGLFDSCKEHTPLESVFEAVTTARGTNPDLLVTVGGGSVIDTAKAVQLALSHDVATFDELMVLANSPTTSQSRLRQIIIPTTISGSEWTNTAGALDVRTKLKVGFQGPDLAGRVIILDPAMTVHTPAGLWLSSAVRSIDHAVEGYCSPKANPFIRANTLYALRLFFDSLPRTKRGPTDLDARLLSQHAVWLATPGLARVAMGASHGLGYLLGSVGGASHGHTSCVLLPAVMRWNEPVTGELQKDLAAAMGDADGNASDLLRGLLEELGVPRTLAEIGITDNMIPEITELAMQSRVVKSNPRPIMTEQDVLEILALAG